MLALLLFSHDGARKGRRRGRRARKGKPDVPCLAMPCFFPAAVVQGAERLCPTALCRASYAADGKEIEESRPVVRSGAEGRGA